MARRFVIVLVFSLSAIACSNDVGGGNDLDEGGGDTGGDRDQGDTVTSTDDDTSGERCVSSGLAAPQNTFTLPAGGQLYYPDIQSSFADVDWQTLDRLYIPAGNYEQAYIGNLPERTAERPLVITNHGGQVKIGPTSDGNYLWAMSGGSNWILTGHYDAEAQTGDAAFPGHDCSAYATSRGRYGFLSDDNFDEEGAYLHMGLSVENATAFEVSFLEVANTGFAGMRFLNPHTIDTLKPMDDVRVHDNYIHDTLGEGIYFGWTGAAPSSIFRRLHIYENRIVRTGYEGLQIQDLGDGTHVHDNVIAFGGLAWLFSGLGPYQDNNSQISTREGTIVFEDNVFLRGPGTITNIFSSPQDTDGERYVTFRRNYLADTSTGLITYINGSATADSTFTFTNNWFRDVTFDYTQANPSSTAYTVLFGINSAVDAAITLEGNYWEGTSTLTYGITGGTGTSGNVTATGNVNDTVTPIAFADTGYPATAPTRALRLWSARATIQETDPLINYAVGDLVMHRGVMYQCLTANSDTEPTASSPAWEALPTPTDDFRVTPGSPYVDIGIH